MPNRDDFERMMNTQMKWFHKLPYWLLLVLIALGLGKLLGLV